MIPLVSAYNLTVFIIVFANVFLSAFFFQKLGFKVLPASATKQLTLRACAAGLLFGLSPYVLARTNGHLNLAFVAGFPALAWAIGEAWSSSKIVPNAHRSLRGLALAVNLLVLGSLQYLLIAFVLCLPCLLFFQPKRIRRFLQSLFSNRRELLMTMFWVALGIGVFYLFFYGYLYLLFSHTLRSAPRGGFNPKWIDLVIPNPYFGPYWRTYSSSFEAIGKSVFLGVSTFFILGVFLSSRVTNALKITIILALGYVLTLLFRIINIPFVSSVLRNGSYGRYVVGLLLIASCVLVLSKKFTSRILWITILLIVADRMLLSVGMNSAVPVDEFAMARTIPGQGILAVPPGSPQGNLIPYFTGKKLVDGLFHYNGDTAESKSFLLSLPSTLFKCRTVSENREDYRKALNRLLEHDVQTIFLRKSACSAVRNVMNGLAEQGDMRLVGIGQAWEVYQLVSKGDAGPNERD